MKKIFMSLHRLLWNIKKYL